MKRTFARFCFFVASVSLAENTHHIEAPATRSSDFSDRLFTKPKVDVCKDPWAAVCASRPAAPSQADLSTEEILEQAFNAVPGLKQALSSNNSSKINTNEVQRQYAAFLQAVHSRIMDEWAKRGITEQTISNRVHLIRSLIAAKLNPTQDAAAIARLQKVEVTWPSRIFKSGPGADVPPLTFFSACGFDGLTPGAFYHPATNTLILCPGFLASGLESSLGLEQFDLIISHELGHSFGPMTQVSSSSKFDPFIKCIDKRYGRQLTTPKAVREYISSTGMQLLVKELKRAESADPPDADRILNLQRTIFQIQIQMPTMVAQEQLLNQLFPPRVTAAQSHSDELLADASASEALAQLAKNGIPKEILLIQLAYFCPADPEGAKLAKRVLANKGDDGIHPPSPMRVDYMLSNPNLRKVFGCQDKSPSRNWCAPR